MDLNALLAAREAEGPSGENLEYDFDFMQMQIAAQPGEERQAGSAFIPAKEPDFDNVEQRALSVLARSHDLRAAVILAGAVLNTSGLRDFADAIAYIRGCLEHYWETCHPLLDADDDNDPQMRINAVQGLAEVGSVMAAPTQVMVGLRRMPLTASRTFGKLTIRDIQIAYGEVPPPENTKPAFDKAAVTAAFVDTGKDAVAATLALMRAVQTDVKAIDGVFAVKTPGKGPDLDELKKLLQQIVRHLAEHAGAGPVAKAAEGAPLVDEPDAAPAAPAARRGEGSSGGVPGVIETSDDARAALDQVIDYFRRFEPSSPVPVILERARRLVGADFLTIMKDMAPAGVDNVMMIGGISPN